MDAIVAGASGYLLKDAGVGEVLAGIEAVARGKALVSPQIAGKLLDRVRAQAAHRRRRSPPRRSLGARAAGAAADRRRARQHADRGGPRDQPETVKTTSATSS